MGGREASRTVQVYLLVTIPASEAERVLADPHNRYSVSFHAKKYAEKGVREKFTGASAQVASFLTRKADSAKETERG